MAAPSHRSALGALFLVLAAAFGGVAFAAASAGDATGWVIAVAAAALGFWLLGLSGRALFRR
jgi:hypothetical protein